MKKIENRFLSAIIVGIVAVVYSILVFVIKDMENAGGNFWGGYLFTMLAFAVTAALFCITKLSQSKTIATQSPLIFGTLIYLGATLVINIIFICLNKDTKTTAMVIINVLILLAYIAYAIIMYMGMRHMGQASEKIVEKRQHIADLEVKVVSLVYAAKDEGVKRALTKLKDDVKYSGRSGSDASEPVLEAEENFTNQLAVIKSLLSEGAEAADVLDAIQEASNLLKLRNEILVTHR